MPAALCVRNEATEWTSTASDAPYTTTWLRRPSQANRSIANQEEWLVCGRVRDVPLTQAKWESADPTQAKWEWVDLSDGESHERCT